MQKLQPVLLANVSVLTHCQMGINSTRITARIFLMMKEFKRNEVEEIVNIAMLNRKHTFKVNENNITLMYY